MASSQPQPSNYSIKAIPGVFMLGIAPHGYYLARMMAATSLEYNNAA